MPVQASPAKRLATGLAVGLMLMNSPSALLAQAGPSAADIVQALKPKPKAPAVRGLAGNRGITVEGGDTTAPPPSIDLQVNFEFDSSNLTNDAQLSLKALGEALKSKDLAGLRFRLIGHTDSRGTAEYNMELSRRRANTVRAYLTQYHSITGDRLEAEGRGKTELIDRSNPESGLNRRVQVITIGAMASR